MGILGVIMTYTIFVHSTSKIGPMNGIIYQNMGASAEQMALSLK
jgi:hypothetical protein